MIMVFSVLVVNGHAGGAVAEGWFLAAPVGLAFDDELVGGGGEPVDGGLGQERVGHHGQPFLGGPVGGHDRGAFAVALDAELVEVGGLGGVEGLEREVVALSGVRTSFRHVSAGSGVADASATWSGADAVLVQEAAQAEHFAVGGSELLLELADCGAAGVLFLAELDGEDVHDVAVICGRGRRLGGRPGALLGAQFLDAMPQVVVAVEEVDADSGGAGDGPEVDLLAVLDELADRCFGTVGGGLPLGLGRLAQCLGPALASGGGAGGHDGSGLLVMVRGTGSLAW